MELVTQYLEGALPERERERFENHLKICKGCRNYLEQMRQTIALTGHLTVEDIPAQGAEELLEVFRAWKRSSA